MTVCPFVSSTFVGFAYLPVFDHGPPLSVCVPFLSFFAFFVFKIYLSVNIYVCLCLRCPLSVCLRARPLIVLIVPFIVVRGKR